MTTTMTSTYLRYLPPVLWEGQESPTGFSLETMLLVFEKLLTGVADDTAIVHRDHQHQPLEQVIANLYKLFDPWQTPTAFLPWLASWLGLTLVVPNWDEYQQRKAIAEMTHIYRQRGLKAALQRYLSLYTVVETRPRIVIDDGSKVLFMRPQANCLAPVQSLVSQGYFVSANPAPSYSGLLHPWCLAAAPDGSMFIGDRGTLGASATWPFTNPIPSQVWHLSATSAYPFFGSPPVPQPLTVTGLTIHVVEALAVRTLASGDWELYILDALGTQGTLYRLPSNLGSASVAANVTLSHLVVAMAIDNQDNLLIVERGDDQRSIEQIPPPATPPPPPANPSITIVPLSVQPVTPANITSKTLQQVIEPLSLLVLPNNKLLIGDGGKQNALNPTTNTNVPLPKSDVPANLVYVDYSDPNPSNWTEIPLLTSVNNPLIAPTALVRQDDTHIFILDAGLKPFTPDQIASFTLQAAEPAAIYLATLTRALPATAPTITLTQVSESGNMVYPKGMVLSQGTLMICDYGQPETLSTPPTLYRVFPHRFGVVIHFCRQRLPLDQAAQIQLIRQITVDITNIVNQEKPAHTLYQIVTDHP